jgi:hypothetical protein
MVAMLEIWRRRPICKTLLLAFVRVTGLRTPWDKGSSTSLLSTRLTMINNTTPTTMLLRAIISGAPIWMIGELMAKDASKRPTITSKRMNNPTTHRTPILNRLAFCFSFSPKLWTSEERRGE